MERSEWADGDDADDGPVEPLLPPSERWWRHPSELGSHPPAPVLEPSSSWGLNAFAVVLVLGLIGAIVVAVVTRDDTDPALDSASTSVVGPDSRPAEALTALASTSTVAGVLELVDARGRVATAAALGDTRIAAPADALDGATGVTAILPDGSEEDAEVVAVADETGVAVLELASPLTTVATGRAVMLQPGDTVRAASPGAAPGEVLELGVRQTSEDGADRSHLLRLRIDGSVDDGTVVLDDDGNAVAMCIGTDDDGNVLAVPIELARSAIANSSGDGSVAVPWLGIFGRDAADGLAGAEVVELEAEGPAQRAGVRVGDVITELDGDAVSSMDALVLLVRDREPQAAVTLTVERDGETISMAATVGRRP